MTFLCLVQQEEGDLTEGEFNGIWEKAPKFPDLETSEERIDVDSFVQAYRNIDDLFEDDDDDDEQEETDPPTKSDENAEQKVTETVEESNISLIAELETVFQSLCDEGGLITKDKLRNWDELQNLFEEGLLSKDEFEETWNKATINPEAPDQLDLEGFLNFNEALDDLFDIEEDDQETVESPENKALPSTEPKVARPAMVEDEDLSPAELFEALANEDKLVGKEEMSRWGELQEMIAGGDLQIPELDSLFSNTPKSSKDETRFDKAGFIAFYEAIDDLFEDVEEDDDEEIKADDAKENTSASSSSRETKDELLRALELINSDDTRLSCGLEATEQEQRYILGLVNSLETEPSNIIKQKQAGIEEADLTGDWDLMYTSSDTMRFNQGLSGIGGSFPNGKFGGLQMSLQSSKVVADVEYLERVEVNPSSASFDVRVTGSWELRNSVSLFSGEPSIVLTVVPDRVMYPTVNMNADHWKSLGPANMLDVAYLDEDLRIMRGNTAVDNVFIFRRGLMVRSKKEDTKQDNRDEGKPWFPF